MLVPSFKEKRFPHRLPHHLPQFSFDRLVIGDSVFIKYVLPDTQVKVDGPGYGPVWALQFLPV